MDSKFFDSSTFPPANYLGPFVVLWPLPILSIAAQESQV